METLRPYSPWGQYIAHRMRRSPFRGTHHVRKRVAIEAAISDFWRKYVGLDGAVIGMTGFGASAPADALYKHFGITAEAVVEAAKSL